jgi:glycosyltransferase involved in cell wall biosynthesis
MTNITVIILTKNEENDIERCIRSVKGWVKRIVVVDSGSTDRTTDIAKDLGVEVVTHEPFLDYAKQFNWAIDNLNIQTTWVFRLDADEVVTPELRKELEEKLAQHHDDDVTGLMMRYKVSFLGRYLKHGGFYPFLKITIFKYGKGRFEDRAMGEHIVLSEGRCIDLKNDAIHYAFKSIDQYVLKHNWYATREVQDYFDVRSGRENAQLDGQPEKAKKLRDGLYYRLPMFLRAKLFFWYRYYLRLGFLDGTPGYIFAFLQAYWYRTLVDAKIYERNLNKDDK